MQIITVTIVDVLHIVQWNLDNCVNKFLHFMT